MGGPHFGLNSPLYRTYPAKTTVSPHCLLLGTFREEECLWLRDRNSLLKMSINVYIIKPVVMGFQMWNNLFNCMFSIIVVFICKWALRKTQMLLLKRNIFCKLILPVLLIINKTGNICRICSSLEEAFEFSWSSLAFLDILHCLCISHCLWIVNNN